MSHALHIILWLVQTALAAVISAVIKLALDDYFKMSRMYPIGYIGRPLLTDHDEARSTAGVRGRRGPFFWHLHSQV